MAGKSAGFAIGIGIEDGASAGLDAIDKRIAATTAPADRFNKSLANFGDATGINRAAKGIEHPVSDATMAALRQFLRGKG